MSEVKGAIPKLLIFILGIWLAIPSEIDIYTLILQKFEEAFPSPVITLSILGLRMLGVLLIIVDVLLIIRQFREGEYF